MQQQMADNEGDEGEEPMAAGDNVIMGGEEQQ